MAQGQFEFDLERMVVVRVCMSLGLLLREKVVVVRCGYWGLWRANAP